MGVGVFYIHINMYIHYICTYAYIHCGKIIFEINHTWAKKKRLGEKTTVLRFQRKPLRRKDLNAPNVYRKVIPVNVRTCPFDSHMCSIVNL